MREIINNQQEQAYHEIKEKIMKLIYQPGQRISEKQITDDIQVGRTPVREALIQLKREGLIQIFPQSGTYISKIDLNSAIHARYVREHIEQFVVMESTAKITDSVRERFNQLIKQQIDFSQRQDRVAFFTKDEEFHHLFYEITDKVDIWNWLQLFNSHLNRFRLLSLQAKELQWNRIINQHQQIVRATVNGEADEAQFLTSQHLHLMLNEKDLLLSLYPDFFYQHNDQ